MLKKLIRLFEFQQKSAHEIRNNPNHDDHTDCFNEKYWHGWEAAIRYAKNIVQDMSDIRGSEQKVSKICDGVTIKIRRETRERTKGLGKKGETYDDIINRYLDKTP